MRVVLYGFGRNLKKEYHNLIDFELVAIADKRADEISQMDREKFQCPFVLPSEICKFEFNYVVVTSVAMFESMKQQLICENGINPLKVVSMQLFLKKNQPKDFELQKKRIRTFFGTEVDFFTEISNETDYMSHICDRDGRRYSTTFFDFYQKKWEAPKSVDGLGVYVVTHKDYDFPQYPSYVPIAVGDYEKDGFLDDRSGARICSLNNKINEMTALYWVWKNKKTDIIGFCHYRRFFCDNEIACFENLLKPQTIKTYLEEAELIVNEQTIEEHTVFEILKMPLSERASEDGYRLIEDGVKKHQPEYLTDFYEVMNGHTLCYYNMFVTTWDIFDAYCEWLFSFLIPAAEEFDVDAYEGQDKRTIGFFAERMLSVWLHHNPLKIKSLPVFTP
ncbi:MAG: DUF4422 domain-containing protein [Lachnospiraceae bacterium]|nr:DUF4422 domain-containing protein [Lachnospiraceae bacterium]